MERFFGEACVPERMSALNLAFIGDCVFDLFVREYLVCTLEAPVNTLHRRAVEQVCCGAQAKAAQQLMPCFTEEEKQIYLRGRNAHTAHLPRNATPADYHAATALEAVFGYLYLKGELDRLRFLFTVIRQQETKDRSDGT